MITESQLKENLKKIDFNRFNIKWHKHHYN